MCDDIVREITELVKNRMQELSSCQSPIFYKHVFMQHLPAWLNTAQRSDLPCPSAIQKSLGLQWRFYTPGKNVLSLDILNELGSPVSEKAAKSTDVALWMSGASHTRATFVPPNSFTFTFEPSLLKPVTLRCRVNGQNVFSESGGIRQLCQGFETRAHCLGAWCVDAAQTFTAVCPLGRIENVCTDGVLLACEQRISYSSRVRGFEDERDHWEFSRYTKRVPYTEPPPKVIHYARDVSGCAFMIFDKTTNAVVKTIDRTEEWMEDACISTLLQVSSCECLAVDAQSGRCIIIDVVRGSCKVISQCDLSEPAEFTEANPSLTEVRFYSSARKRFTCLRWNWQDGKNISSWTLSLKEDVVSVVSNADFVFLACSDRSVIRVASADGSCEVTFDVHAVVSPMATSLRLLMPNPHVLVALDSVHGCFSSWDANTRQLAAASRHTDLLRLQFSCASAFDNRVYLCSSSGRFAVMA
jgi:hypothetical protein